MCLHQIEPENEMLTDFPVNLVPVLVVQFSFLFQHHLKRFVSFWWFTIVDDARGTDDGCL